MQLGQMIGVAASPRGADVASSGLTHDWKMNERLQGPLVDRIGGLNLTTAMGQALDYIPNDYSIETGATDYQLAFLDGKKTATCGFLINKDANGGKAGPGYYYGDPFCLGLDANHIWRIITNGTPSENNLTIDSSLCPPIGSWTTAVVRVDIENSLWETSFNGAVVANTPSRTPLTTETFKVNADNRRKLVLGNTSSNTNSWASASPINGKIGRFFITSNLLTIEQSETILRGAPADFPTLTDGHIYCLDTEGTTSTCLVDGVSTVTHNLATPSANWANGSKQQNPFPQKALGRGAYSDGQGVAFNNTGTNSRLLATYGPSSSPTPVRVLPDGDMTVHIWAKITGTPSAANTLLQLRELSGDYTGLRVFCQAGSASLRVLADPGVGTQLFHAVAPTVHGYNWVHLIYVNASGTGYWYHYLPGSDTETAGTPGAQAPPSSANAVVVLGCAQLGADYSDNGQLGRVLVYDRALSADERLKNHKAMRGDYA